MRPPTPPSLPRRARSLRPARPLLSLPLLLLAAAAGTAGAAATARAASGTGSGDDFQYVNQRDKVQVLQSPRGCVEAGGGGARGVANRTTGTATLYPRPGCTGSPLAVLPPGGGGQITPRFASVRFDFTTTAQRP
ncbi:hypothetical protein AB0953_35040 [Streptomyces sp. NPDC046866]|uniref:hypothetical protein n=1 Tax=Streptomyces sp. NPDC046866 TaxID=3154921 RepID=UPI00345319A3